jgi:hypothetical protein
VDGVHVVHPGDLVQALAERAVVDDQDLAIARLKEALSLTPSLIESDAEKAQDALRQMENGAPPKKSALEGGKS